MADSPYQFLPALSEEEYAALRDDIAANGIRVPVDVDENGAILDGHHRRAIAAELGISCPTRVVAGLTEDDKRAHALSVNLQRRTLTRDQRRALVLAELEHDPSRSDRAIARLVGVDHKTVGAIRRGGWGIPQPDADPVLHLRGDEPPRPISQQEAQALVDALRAGLDHAAQLGAEMVDTMAREGFSRRDIYHAIGELRAKWIEQTRAAGGEDVRDAFVYLIDPAVFAPLLGYAHTVPIAGGES